MKKGETVKRLILMMCCLGLLSACAQAQINHINSLKRPVIVVSKGTNGDILLQGSDGTFYLVHGDTYLGGALQGATIGTELGAKIKGYRYASKLLTCRKCGAEIVVNGEKCE